jgi:hypothetical protein
VWNFLVKHNFVERLTFYRKGVICGTEVYFDLASRRIYVDRYKNGIPEGISEIRDGKFCLQTSYYHKGILKGNFYPKNKIEKLKIKKKLSQSRLRKISFFWLIIYSCEWE